MECLIFTLITITLASVVWVFTLTARDEYFAPERARLHEEVRRLKEDDTRLIRQLMAAAKKQMDDTWGPR